MEDAHSAVVVNLNDLVALLDYVQPDEERDIEENPENDTDVHIVYPIRRLRKLANAY